MKTRVFVAFGILPLGVAAVPGPAEGGTGNALALLNAYLAQEALTSPEYRADLQPGKGSAEIPAGRFPGCGPFLGPFTYRPKTYGELSPAARAVLLREPKLRAFLVRKRGDPAPQGERFSIEPEEMLSARPLAVALPNR